MPWKEDRGPGRAASIKTKGRVGRAAELCFQSDIIPQVENPDFSVPATILVEKVQMFSAPCNLLHANISTLEKRFILIM